MGDILKICYSKELNLRKIFSKRIKLIIKQKNRSRNSEAAYFVETEGVEPSSGESTNKTFYMLSYSIIFRLVPEQQGALIGGCHYVLSRNHGGVPAANCKDDVSFT